jgi:peptidyl-prolyl cis-trans isomerase C
MSKWALPLVCAMIALMVLPPAYASDSLPASDKPADAERTSDVAGNVETGQEPVAMEIPFDSPLFSNTPVAVVNGEPITFSDLRKERELQDSRMQGASTGRMSASDLLERIITKRLIKAEAENIGLDELPGMKENVKAFSKEHLRDMLLKRHLEELNLHADEGEVEKAYEGEMKEVKLKSIMLEKKEDAEEVLKRVEAGSDFDEVADELVEGGTVKAAESERYVKVKELLPQVTDALAKMDVGSVSPIIEAGPWFAIFRLQDVRIGEDETKKNEIRERLLRPLKLKALKDYYLSLKKKYVKVNKKALDGLNYDSEEKFRELLKSKKVLAKIEGEDPLTVGELTDELKMEAFHGIKSAVGENAFNERKDGIFENMLMRKVIGKEALRLGIDRTEKYREDIQNYEDAIVFNAFIKKVIMPDVKVSEEAVRKYYDDNIDEYLSPGMIKIKSLVFGRRKDADNAVEKLRSGADIKWVSDNAEGQVRGDEEGILSFGDNYIMIDTLPEDILKKVSGSRAGDIRLYEGKEGYTYVLYVQDVRESAPQDYGKVRKAIADKLLQKEIMGAVEKWSGQLREAYDTRVFLGGVDK